MNPIISLLCLQINPLCPTSNDDKKVSYFHGLGLTSHSILYASAK